MVSDTATIIDMKMGRPFLTSPLTPVTLTALLSQTPDYTILIGQDDHSHSKPQHFPDVVFEVFDKL
jgi:hypothetical protein